MLYVAIFKCSVYSYMHDSEPLSFSVVEIRVSYFKLLSMCKCLTSNWMCVRERDKDSREKRIGRRRRSNKREVYIESESMDEWKIKRTTYDRIPFPFFIYSCLSVVYEECFLLAFSVLFWLTVRNSLVNRIGHETAMFFLLIFAWHFSQFPLSHYIQ